MNQVFNFLLITQKLRLQLIDMIQGYFQFGFQTFLFRGYILNLLFELVQFYLSALIQLLQVLIFLFQGTQLQLQLFRAAPKGLQNIL